MENFVTPFGRWFEHINKHIINKYLLKYDVFLSFFDKYLLFIENIVLHLWREIIINRRKR